jgi:hypothetical protein
MKRTMLLVAVGLLGAVGCAKEPTGGEATGRQPAPTFQAIGQPGSQPKGKPVRVIFIGNSLTASNDLPALVRAMAASGGVKLEFEACTPGAVNLEDHWNDGRCRNLLNERVCDFVVLQQGPSTRPASQADLKKWSLQWADEARKNGVKPALYMVWPYQNQDKGFELVIQSHSSAAKAARALLLPAGRAWRDVNARSPEIKLYMPDRLHPTAEGTYLAALVITQRLAGVKARNVPSRLNLGAGLVFEIPADRARKLQVAAAAVAGKKVGAD